MKQCNHCQQRKGPTAFWKSTRQPDGLDATCRACRGAMRPPEKRRRQRRPRPTQDSHRDGWCPNCTDGRHGRACTAAFFGPDCTCGCGVLGFRGLFGYNDPTAPGVIDLMEGVG